MVNPISNFDKINDDPSKSRIILNKMSSLFKNFIVNLLLIVPPTVYIVNPKLFPPIYSVWNLAAIWWMNILCLSFCYGISISASIIAFYYFTKRFPDKDGKDNYKYLTFLPRDLVPTALFIAVQAYHWNSFKKDMINQTISHILLIPFICLIVSSVSAFILFSSIHRSQKLKNVVKDIDIDTTAPTVDTGYYQEFVDKINKTEGK